MRERLLRYVKEHAHSLGEETSLEAVEAVLLSRHDFRKHSRQRLTWLMFKNRPSQPFLVARHYADPGSNSLIAQEYEINERLHKVLSCSLVPQPLALAEIHGYQVLFQRFFDGKTLSHELACTVRQVPYNHSQVIGLVKEHLEIAKSLIAKLDALAQPATIQALQTELTALYQACHARMSWENKTEALMFHAGFLRLLELASKIPVCKRIVHLDFVPSNILRGQDDLCLIDWEYHRDSTLRFIEPLKFVYGYLAELSGLGVPGLSPNHHENLKRLLQGELGDIGRLLDQFLESCGLVTEDPVVLRAWWLAYVLQEADLVMSVASVWQSFSPSFRQLLKLFAGAEGVQELKKVNAALHDELTHVLHPRRWRFATVLGHIYWSTQHFFLHVGRKALPSFIKIPLKSILTTLRMR